MVAEEKAGNVLSCFCDREVSLTQGREVIGEPCGYLEDCSGQTAWQG